MELMAVITIIVILAALVVGAMSFVNERRAKNQAQVQIELLSKAIQDYKFDMGNYPGLADNTPVDGTGMSEELYEALFYEGFQAAQNPSATPAETGPPKSPLPHPALAGSKKGGPPPATSVPARTKILDPWGREYRYRKGTNAQNADFDIWSTGKDGETNPANSPGALKDPKNRDDLKNF